MATDTQGRQTREHPLQHVSYLRKTVNYNDVGISSGIGFARWLPAGASILYAFVKIKTAFNAGTTNVLTCGQNASSYNDIVNSTDVDESTVAATMVLRGADLDLTSDVQAFIKYAQTGTAATAGKAEVTIAFTCNNDE